jgi:phenylpyruvate tautomerase PptA (4-oxalocrotonate tautomerase family)
VVGLEAMDSESGLQALSRDLPRSQHILEAFISLAADTRKRASAALTDSLAATRQKVSVEAKASAVARVSEVVARTAADTRREVTVAVANITVDANAA